MSKKNRDKMSAKGSEGEHVSLKHDKIVDGSSNGNRFSRSYKCKPVERSIADKKLLRTKTRNRVDDTSSVLSGPIKMREKARLVSDHANSDDLLKPGPSVLKIKEKGKGDDLLVNAPLKMKDKAKALDLAKDETTNTSGSSRGRDKGKLPEELSKEESSSKRDRSKSSDVKDDSSPIVAGTSKLREKSKQNLEVMKGEAPFIGNAPVKLREKMKAVDTVKEDSPLVNIKGREKSKSGLDATKEGSSVSGTLPGKGREKFKPVDTKEEGASNFLVPVKEHDKLKSTSQLLKDDNVGIRTSPFKLREKIKIADSSREDTSSFASSSKVRDKNKSSNDSSKPSLSISPAPSTRKEKGKFSEKAGDSDILPSAPIPGKSREKITIIGDFSDDSAASEASKKTQEKVHSFNELRNGESKSEVSTSDKMKIDVDTSNSCEENGSPNGRDRDGIMYSDVSSSQDHSRDQITSKLSSNLKAGQNRSTSRLREENEWHPGDLAWGRIGQHPFWPCMISVENESGQFMKIKKVGRDLSSRDLHVQFFGDKGRHSWIPLKNALKYEGRDKLQRFSEGVLAQLKKKDKKFISSFVIKSSSRPRWELAIQEADKAMALSREQRKSYFDKIVKNLKTSVPSDGKKEKSEVAAVEQEKKRRNSIPDDRASKKVKANPGDKQIPLRKRRGRNKI